VFLTLTLLMLGVFADNHDAALALDNFAFFAYFFNRRSDFHGMDHSFLETGGGLRRMG